MKTEPLPADLPSATQDPTDAQARNVDALLAFLPRLKAAGFEFARERPLRKDDQGRYVIGGPSLNPVVLELVQALYEHGWVDGEFEWTTWAEQAQRYERDAALVAHADIRTLRKLLTAHVRADRFCDGHLASVWRSGHLCAVLERLAALRGAATPACPPEH
jgi:hypothetical protein